MYAAVACLLQPLPLAILGSLAAVVWAWRKCPPACRRPLKAIAAILVLLWVGCTALLAHLATWSLERRYPPESALPPKADVIVVLASGVRVWDEAGQRAELDAEGTLRCLHAARVYRQAGPCPIVASGGKVSPEDLGPPQARVMRDFLVELGVAPGDVLVEDASRTTYENAVNSAKLLRQNRAGQAPPDTDAGGAGEAGGSTLAGAGRVVLVTDATHMIRSVGCFRAQGVEVIPAACNYRAAVFQWSPRKVIPSAEAACHVHAAVHEWLGILWYRLHGRL